MNENKRTSRMVLLGVAILVGGVLITALVVGSVQAAGPAQPPPPVGRDVWPYSGMMGGWGGYGLYGPSRGFTPTLDLPFGYYGRGMMSGRGGWGSGCGSYGGMMGGFGYGYGGPVAAQPLTLDEAVEAAEAYIAAYGDPDPAAGSGQALTLAEVMEFSRNFYAAVEEESTGIHAFELLINRYTGQVYPEPGPNMMWNTKYGHMGGWWGGTPGGEMTVTPAQARQYARQYLERYLPGTTVAEEADAFYGYYTIHVLQDGQIVGMLSVNGASGRVWYHTWHGDFIGMAEGHD